MKITILFDLDGTLINSTEAILESFDEAYKVMGQIPPNKNDILKLIGVPLDLMFREFGVNENLIQNFINAYKFHYRKISKQKTYLLDNALESIKIAHSFASLGIVTTKTGLYSKELLENMKILQYFDVLIGYEDVQNPKPHEEPILKAIDYLKADKKNTWMIGDTMLDIDSANNAKIKSIAVKNGYGAEEELKKCAKIIKNNSLEAVNFIKNLTEIS